MQIECIRKGSEFLLVLDGEPILLTSDQLKGVAQVTNARAHDATYNHMPISLFSHLGITCQWCGLEKDKWTEEVCQKRPVYVTAVTT